MLIESFKEGEGVFFSAEGGMLGILVLMRFVFFPRAFPGKGTFFWSRFWGVERGFKRRVAFLKDKRRKDRLLIDQLNWLFFW